MRLRKSVKRFAQEMERTLRENEEKGGWEDCPLDYLAKKLNRELEELQVEIEVGEVEFVCWEAVDVANYAMMIYDNAKARQPHD